MRYKNITIQKISDHGGTEQSPTHALVVRDSNYQNKVTVGKLWTKESQYGKFLSGLMENEREYENKDKQTVKVFGYCIVKDDYLDELEAIAEKYQKLVKESEQLLDSKKEEERLANITVDENGNHSDIPF